MRDPRTWAARIAFIAPCVAVAWALAACGGVRIPDVAPSVFLVVWDTTRADHLSIYGYRRDTTPTLAAIAEKGVIFDQANAVGTWTIPSVASLFTGLLQQNHGVDWESGKKRSLTLADGVTTLAEALRGAGYATALFSAQKIYMRQGGFLQGFDDVALTRRGLVERTLDFVDRNPDRPVFVVAYWKDPHAQYRPPRKYDRWSDPDRLPYTLKSGKSTRPEHIDPFEVRHGITMLEPEQIHQMEAKYDGEILKNDAELDLLWRGLESRGLADRSLFVFTSDHGEAFGDHEKQLVGHGLPYESNQRVPLVLRLPGTLPPGRIADLVRSIDVYPTVLEIAGVALSHPINGVSLLPLVGSRSSGFAFRTRADRSYAGETHHPAPHSYFRTARYELIRDETTGALEVYDIVKDPLEGVNLADSRPALVRELGDRRAEFLEKTRIPIEGAPASPVMPEELERLEALGYGG